MEYINDIFEEFALGFIGRLKSDSDIAFPNELNRDGLDFSLQSLKVLDSYLDHLHEHRDQIAEDAWSKTVLWGGAYLGEVIRRSAKREYNWVDYNEYMPHNPTLKGVIPNRTVATCAFLCVTGSLGMTMPLNKIARYIEDGQENNTFYYASVECQQTYKPDSDSCDS